MKVKFNSIQEARKFVDAMGAFDFDVNLQDGRIVVDAKSVIGVLNLDFRKTFDLCAVTKLKADLDKLREAAKPYAVER